MSTNDAIATVILLTSIAAVAVPIYRAVRLDITTRALSRRMDRFTTWHRAQCERGKAGLLTPEEETALQNITIMVITRRGWDYRGGPWEEEP